jgi:hypothetical protein
LDADVLSAIIFLGVLYLTMPCFQVDVAVDPAFSLELRALHDEQLTAMIDDPGQHEIEAEFCGRGDWVVETRVAPSCELDCTWDDWQITLTAHVGTRPEAPDLYVAEITHETQ